MAVFLDSKHLEKKKSLETTFVSLQTRKETCSQVQDKLRKIQVDSACSRHMFSDKQLFTNLEKKKDEVFLADSSAIETHGVGEASITCRHVSGERVEVCFSNVLYVPSFSCNLLSLGQLAENYKSVSLNGSTLKITEDCQAEKLNYKTEPLPSWKPHSTVLPYLNRNYRELNHARFGHPGEKKTKQIETLFNIKLDHGKCKSCLLSKNNRTHFAPSPIERQAKEILHTVSFDTAVVKKISTDGYKYVIGFVEHKSRYLWIALMKSKADAYDQVRRFESIIGIPKCYRTDNEFNKKEFRAECLERRIRLETTCPYSSQQNAIIETQWRALYSKSQDPFLHRAAYPNHSGATQSSMHSF